MAFVLASSVVALVAENWLAALFEDDLIATMLILIAGVVTIALALPLLVRPR